MQQGRLGDERQIEIEMVSLVAEDESAETVADGESKHYWRSRATIAGHEYSWIHTVANEKKATHEAAAMLLEKLLPGEEIA